MNARLLAGALALAVMAASAAPASASHRHHHHHWRAHHAHRHVTHLGRHVTTRHHRSRFHRALGRGHVTTRIAYVAGAGRLLPHPVGCPRVAFCGCGAAVRVFGHAVRRLWLAANWFRFPRAEPAPGHAAVRPHHVMVLVRHIRGHVWWVYDANSGHHRTRLHPRSIAGFVIVDPRAS